MEPVFADFSIRPARLSNAVVAHHRCGVASSHLALGGGGYIKLDFTVDEREEIAEAAITVTTLGGDVPMDVSLNGKALGERQAVPADGGLGAPQQAAFQAVFAAPGDLLAPGDNILEIRSPEGADTLLRLRAVTVDPAHDRGRAERALVARVADIRSVVTFDTERRTPGTTVWQPAPQLLFHLDAGDRAVPAHLAWRGADGSEAAIGVRADLSGFQGHWRGADGALAEYRGTLTDRSAYPEGTTDAPLYLFSTEEAQGESWSPSGELKLLLDAGGTPVERVSWTDRLGNTASIELSPAAAPAVETATTGELHDVTRTVTGIRASEEFGAAGEIAENLLRSSHNKWLAHEDTADIEFVLDPPAAVSTYRLTSANDAPGRDPRDWVLAGSYDGRTWSDLDSRSGERFRGRFETNEYEFTNTTPYTHYRLSITDNAGSSEIQLSQIELFAGEIITGPTPDSADFTGYRTPAGGEPVGYRGTTVPGPWSDTEPKDGRGEELLAGELGETARTLDEAARLIDKLAAYLKHAG
ncbi:MULTISPECIES: alpha-1,2-mannosidase [unclassified Streptomyces]|uniref:alpha-1,2-mannosidase n=1 Tax=unclassified Streptomyces TaxID=2593676 RepID=UPI002E7A0EEF|nr:alpha-1,2-mannosidase [Streptomyces sp. JV176]MEE1803845.1 alpha-1,2-mannosidase [Streptomyces sp. JV176]